MALLSNCCKCGAAFAHSASDCGMLCHNCDGTNEAKRQEKARWDALSNEAKIEELLVRIQGLEQQQSWDGRIG